MFFKGTKYVLITLVLTQPLNPKQHIVKEHSVIPDRTCD